MLSARIQPDIRSAYQQTEAVGIVGIAQLDSRRMITEKPVHSSSAIALEIIQSFSH